MSYTALESSSGEITPTTWTETIPKKQAIVPAPKMMKVAGPSEPDFPIGIVKNTSNAFFGLLADLIATPRLSASILIDLLTKDFRYMYLALLVIVVILTADLVDQINV